MQWNLAAFMFCACVCSCVQPKQKYKYLEMNIKLVALQQYENKRTKEANLFH